MKAPGEMDELLAIMARLRDPEGGCPWDVEQTFASIAPYTIEEAYEVADAIDRGDLTALRDELGDLLLQVVFHARMAEESGSFDFADVWLIAIRTCLPAPALPMPRRRREPGRRTRSANAAPPIRTRVRWPASPAACRSGSARSSCRSARLRWGSTGRVRHR
jgi:NTP pyrophosphatase (non-canonical NTP hydrolase)